MPPSLAFSALPGASVYASDIGLTLGYLTSAAAIRSVGNRLNRVYDEHRFLTVPMQHWMWAGLGLAGIGVVMMLSRAL